jgi:hypothetical protein
MATNDRFRATEHQDASRNRALNLRIAQDPRLWFAIAAAGLLAVFSGLMEEASSSSPVVDFSWSHPGFLIIAVGAFAAAAAVMVGMTITSLRGLTSGDAVIRRMAPLIAGWVAVAAVAVGSMTYVAVNGGPAAAGAQTATAAVHVHGDGTDLEGAAIAEDLQQNGISPDSGTPTSSQAAAGGLPQGADGHGGSAHDKGKQPTYTQIETMSDAQLLPLFPANTMTLPDIPLLRAQLEQVHAAALKYPDPASAKAAGYVRTTSDVPYMGEHYLNYAVIKSGKFDPSRPSGLLFSTIDNSGTEKLVGIWYLMVPGIGGVTGDAPPSNTWAGNLALWHEHDGLCLVGVTGASEGETPASCQAKGGSYTASLKWMMHVWVAPVQDNPDGVFAYLNNDLFAKQQAAANQPSAPSGAVAP